MLDEVIDAEKSAFLSEVLADQPGLSDADAEQLYREFKDDCRRCDDDEFDREWERQQQERQWQTEVATKGRRFTAAAIAPDGRRHRVKGTFATEADADLAARRLIASRRQSAAA